MYFAYKYDRMEEGLLASTNAGGENVARGATLGALYGAAGGMAAIPTHLKTGLHNHDAIEMEIERYIKGLEGAMQKSEL
jgi:ADP-ribosylglycohydrolase|eukprot:COSAG02_NODE_1108_length_14539_cov_4.353393_15_plen_79_part_00